MTNFSKIPSQFDNIPQDCPIVFISYSWDSEEHKTWVKKLSDELRQKHRIYTLLDQYNRAGYDLLSFMNQAIQKAHRVLIIGTPEYKRKSESAQGGGVKYEDQLITTEIYHKFGTSKFIPILREGSFETAFTSLMGIRTGYDMKDNSTYEEKLNELAADIWNKPINAAPELGVKPSYAKGINKYLDNKELTIELFVNKINQFLSSNNSVIPYIKMIERETQIVYDKIHKKAHYDFKITPQIFEGYINYHLKAVEKLIVSAIDIIHYGNLEQQEVLIDAMVKLCMDSRKNVETSVPGTSALHLLAASFLFHTVGISCIKYGHYPILIRMMKEHVPAGHALSISYPYSLAHLAGINHWDSDILNFYMESSWLYPYSELISKKLKPYFKEYFLNDEEYKDYYAIWEHLFSLMYVYYKNSIFPDKEIFPLGLFLSERIIYNQQKGGDTYSRYFSVAADEQNNWAPLKQGLFNGDYSKYKIVYQKGEAYYEKHRRF